MRLRSTQHLRASCRMRDAVNLRNWRKSRGPQDAVRLNSESRVSGRWTTANSMATPSSK